MSIYIKQIKENQQIIFPQTSAEAVLVKSNNSVITLDTYLKKKTTVIVNNETYQTIAGSEDQTIKLSDDFAVDKENNSIKLTWNGIT